MTTLVGSRTLYSGMRFQNKVQSFFSFRGDVQAVNPFIELSD
jgi:hypothetical protein